MGSKAEGLAGGVSRGVNNCMTEHTLTSRLTHSLALHSQELDNEGEDESSSESEDEGEQLTPAVNLQVLKTIEMIRAKNPKIYEKETVFFNSDNTVPGVENGAPGTPAAIGTAAAAAAAGTDKKQKKKKKKLQAKDTLREQLVAAADAGKEDAFGSDDEDGGGGGGGGYEGGGAGRGMKPYNDETAALKKQFLSSVAAQEEKEGASETPEARHKREKAERKAAKKAAKKAKKAAKEAAKVQNHTAPHCDRVLTLLLFGSTGSNQWPCRQQQRRGGGGWWHCWRPVCRAQQDRGGEGG